MEYTLAAYTYCSTNFDRLVKGMKAAGFRHIGLGFSPKYLPKLLGDMTDADIAGLIKRLEALGLTPVVVCAGSNLLAADGLQKLLALIEKASRFGVKIFDTGSISFANKPKEQVAAETRTFATHIRKAGDFADKLGMTICLETHGGLTGTGASCLDAMRAIAHPRVRLAYDPANLLYYEGVPADDHLDEIMPFIGHTHFKDHRGPKLTPDFPAIGEGNVGYETLIPRLKKGGYRGPWTLERAFGATDDEKDVSLAKAYQFLKRLLEA
jgi:sugar phosphate isomerase/epimerase